MGMYTEVVVKCDLKPRLTNVELAALKFLFSDGPEPSELPDHRFFSLPRWMCIGRDSSYYHIPEALNHYDPDDDIDRGAYLFSRSDLKNYDGEIEAFFDWLRPLVDKYCDKTCIGWMWYEEDEEPTLVYVGGR